MLLHAEEVRTKTNRILAPFRAFQLKPAEKKNLNELLDHGSPCVWEVKAVVKMYTDLHNTKHETSVLTPRSKSYEKKKI